MLKSHGLDTFVVPQTKFFVHLTRSEDLLSNLLSSTLGFVPFYIIRLGVP